MDREHSTGNSPSTNERPDVTMYDVIQANDAVRCIAIAIVSLVIQSWAVVELTGLAWPVIQQLWHVLCFICSLTRQCHVNSSLSEIQG